MGSRFELYFSDYFIDQWKSYDQKTKDSINSKFPLIAENPFRFKKHEGYKHVFKVKLSIQNRYSRLVYAVFMPDYKSITILGIFPRDLNYKDFERLFSKLRKR